MSNNRIRCAACNALLPVAKSSVATWFTGLAATGLGVTTTKRWWGRILVAATGFAAGYIIDQLARPVCGSCGVRA